MRLKMKKPSPAFVIACIALFVALGPTAAYAANTVFSTDIVDGQVQTADLGDLAVTTRKIAFDTIGTGRIIDNTVSSADIKGADVKGSISLPAGGVLNGRCADFDLTTSGAKAGEAVVFSLRAAAPTGMLFVGTRVPADNHVTLRACNLTGGTSPAIAGLPVRIMTFG
jgi:hypothetical protein